MLLHWYTHQRDICTATVNTVQEMSFHYASHEVQLHRGTHACRTAAAHAHIKSIRIQTAGAYPANYTNDKGGTSQAFWPMTLAVHSMSRLTFSPLYGDFQVRVGCTSYPSWYVNGLSTSKPATISSVSSGLIDSLMASLVYPFTSCT